MARHGYVVTEPSDIEGFEEAVLTSRLANTPIRVMATPTTELTLRRGGVQAEPKLFELVPVRINFLPEFSVTLHWPEGQQDISFEEDSGKIRFAVWTAE